MAIEFKNHISLTSCREIDIICQPLYKSGITFFMYEVFYQNGSRIMLSNFEPWNAHFLNNFYKLKYPIHNNFELNIHGSLLISKDIFPKNEVFEDALNFYNLDNGIAIASKRANTKKLCYFATIKNNYTINNFYLNNLDFLKQFILYFENKASSLLKQADKARIKIPKEYNVITPKENFVYPYSTAIEKDILSKVCPDKYYLESEQGVVYLTKREYECALWLAKGKTAEEIGIINNISKRTVEEYITNIKLKLGCNKATELVAKLIQSGLSSY